MARVITLDEVKIKAWTVFIEKQMVHVHYDVLDDTDETIIEGEAFFFVTMPEDGIELPDGTFTVNPDNFYQLPASYVQALTDLTVDADNAITEREIGLP